jgi:hypothetical protein
MTLEGRIAKYLGRGFSREQAQILVLMEEAAIALFSALPEHIVLFGGATLVLFHNSPRLTCLREWTRYLPPINCNGLWKSESRKSHKFLA